MIIHGWYTTRSNDPMVYDPMVYDPSSSDAATGAWIETETDTGIM